ncbi:hypothetical protein C6P75_19005 [Burkholderia multivorans]|nr:hypothetical protein C6P75_19005 [Burkholderia multivorans]PRG29232.1 hypothetical protein C6T68_29990 [Burkholderia multivorans]
MSRGSAALGPTGHKRNRATEVRAATRAPVALPLSVPVNRRLHEAVRMMAWNDGARYIASELTSSFVHHFILAPTVP